MLIPTSVPAGDARIVALDLPTDREWYGFAARGGFDLPWVAGLKWPKKLDWSGLGTPVDGRHPGSVLLLDVRGAQRHFHLWVQHIGDPREAVYLEARWDPAEQRNHIALRGLESNPSDALVSSVARARDWFLPERADGRPGQ